MPKVSVIMPVYNSEKYLKIALDSLCSQTLKDIEIICVDDGSKDNSYSILREYADKDKRFIVLRQENKFAGVARNQGINIATGKYLSFLDSDDYFKPDMLKKAYDCAEKEKADVVIFGGETFSDSLDNLQKTPSLLRVDFLPDTTSNGYDNREKLDKLMNITTPVPWNKLFRKEFINKNKLLFQACKRANDVYFVEMALVLSDKIGIVREDLICYRVQNHQSLQGMNNETPKIFAQSFLSVQEQLKLLGVYKKVEKTFRNLCLSNCIYNLESLTNEKSFEELYYSLKNELFNSFGIAGTEEEDYYNKDAYNKYLFIMNHESDEYKKYMYRGQKRYSFPYEYIKKGSNIIIYGAGKIGTRFYNELQESKYCQIIEWVDSNPDERKSNIVNSAENADYCRADFVVIAVSDEKAAKSIFDRLIHDFKVDYEKIIWKNKLNCK